MKFLLRAAVGRSLGFLGHWIFSHQFKIRLHHLFDEFLKKNLHNEKLIFCGAHLNAHGRLPAERFFRFRCIADEKLNFRRSIVFWIDANTNDARFRLSSNFIDAIA